MPATDEVLTTTPRCPSSSAASVLAIAAAPIRIRLKVPIRFTVITLVKLARLCGLPSRATVRSAQPMPAQLITARSGTSKEAAASTAAPTDASSVTSVRKNSPPVSSAISFPRSSFRSAISTRDPAAARTRAVASPSPLAPPEIIAAVPFSSMPRSIPVRTRPPPYGVSRGERYHTAGYEIKRYMTKLRGNPWAVLIVLSLGFFMTLLDLTIVNIAIPNMLDKLHASLDDVLWVLNAYALVLAVLVITCGRLGDLLGQRTMFVGGIAVFTLASAACGFAPNARTLITFRAVQGLGAAMLMPQTLAMITVIFPAERRGAAFGIWGAVAGAATIAGPTLGGLLVTAFDWRWIFFVNLPIGVLVFIASFLLIPGIKMRRQHQFDITGVLLASAALTAICYGLVEGQRYNWGTITGVLSIPALIGAVLLLLAAFIVQQGRRQRGENTEPLIPFALFRGRNYTLMNWGFR